MRGHLRQRLQRGVGQLLQHPLRSQVEDPRRTYQGGGQKPCGPIPRPQLEQNRRQGQVDGAEQIVGDDLRSGGHHMGGVGRPQGDPGEEPAAQSLDMEGFVKFGRGRGRDREQALAEDDQVSGDEEAKAD